MSTKHQRLYDSDQFVPLTVKILVPAEQVIAPAPATYGDKPAISTLLPDGPQQVEDQRSPGELLAEQGGQHVPDLRATARQDDSPTSSCQPRCRTPLPFPQQVEQNGSASVTTGFQESCEGQAVTMEEDMELVTCRQEWELFPLDLYYDIWYRSSSGDTPDVRAVMHAPSRNWSL